MSQGFVYTTNYSIIREPITPRPQSKEWSTMVKMSTQYISIAKFLKYIFLSRYFIKEHVAEVFHHGHPQKLSILGFCEMMSSQYWFMQLIVILINLVTKNLRTYFLKIYSSIKTNLNFIPFFV